MTAQTVQGAVLQAILLDAAADPRAQQVESGASQTFSCRAESLLRLTGQEPTDPRLSWQAWVGTAIHRELERIGRVNGWVTEQKLTYRGVPCTVDALLPDHAALVDWKSAAGVSEARRKATEPSRERVGQVMLGAAAAREAGFPVDTVWLCILPRESPDLELAWWSAPFSQDAADEAADWHAEQRLRAEKVLAGEPLDLTEIRDRPAFWCRSYCERVTACRGPLPAEPVLEDPAVDEAAVMFLDARDTKDQAEQVMRDMRPLLEGWRGVTRSGIKVLTSGGRGKTETVEDTDALREFWASQRPFDPLPVREVESVTPVRLTVKRVGP